MKDKATLACLSQYVPGSPIADVQKEFKLDKVVKLASNENPFGFSQREQEARAQSLNGLEYYPDGGAKALKKRMRK